MFPLVCFALLTFFLRLEHAVGRVSAAKAEIIACAHPTNSPLLPPPLINQTAEMKRCWYMNRGIGGKKWMAGGLKRNIAAQKKSKRRVWVVLWTWGSPVAVKTSGRVITEGIQWAITDDAVLSGGSPTGMCVYLRPWHETRLNDRVTFVWALKEIGSCAY